MRAFLFHDYEGAFALFDRAIAASPNSAAAWVSQQPDATATWATRAEAKRRARDRRCGSRRSIRISSTCTRALGLACYTGGELRRGRGLGPTSHVAESKLRGRSSRFLAASLAAAGHSAEAQPIARALLDIEPGFRVQRFCDGYAYKDPARRAALAEHLRAAGLPA